MQDTATHNDFDVIIVGARCAGAATARQLALAGARVLVVDRGTEGSDTLSTSYLMPGAVMQLARWGLLPALEAAGTPRVQKVTYHYFAERDVVLDVRASPPVDALYAPRRTVLDPILVQAAREAGAEFRFSVRLERLVHDATGRVVGVVLREGGRIRRLRCDMVVGADGRRSHVAGLVGAEIYRRSRHGSPGVYAYFEGMPLDGYHWYYGPRVYGGAAPTNDGLATVFVGAPSEDLPELFGGDRGAAFPRLSRLLHPAFHEALESARRVGAPRAFPHVPGHYRHSHGPGWALVGDAGYYRDPNTAHGISDALRDAELLALAIGVGTEDALARFQATRDRATARLFEATDRLASYAWDASGVQGILRDVSAGMKEGISALVDATRRAA